MLSDSLGAGAQRHHSLEVLRLVLIVEDRPAVAVQVGPARAPAGGVPLGDDAMHPIRREETILDALTEAVFVDRIAEVEVGIAAFLPQGCRRHAELNGGLEVVEDAAPGAVVACAAAMALVHDNQVEEIRCVSLE